MKIAFALLLLSVLLLGCVTQSGVAEPTASTPTPTAATTAAPTAAAGPTTTPGPTEAGLPATPTVTAAGAEETVISPPADSSPPSISTIASPSNPDRNEVFTLKVSSQDNVGVKTLSWETTDSFSTQPPSNDFDCGSQKNCSVSWQFSSAQNGSKTIIVFASDSSGLKSARVPVQITVRPFDWKPPATPVCGNGVCEKGETNSSCSNDCAPKTVCGNGTCESGETSASCPADCPAATPTQQACSSNEACGYKQICQSGKCVSVDCTNDAQCGYGKECENNRCVRCPTGPYGPAC